MRNPQTQLLHALELFGGTSRRQRRAVSHLGTVLDIPGGKTLAFGGEPCRQLIVVVDGVLLLRGNGDASSMLSAGEWWDDTTSRPYGDMTGVSVGAVRLLVYDRRELPYLLNVCPSVAQRLSGNGAPAPLSPRRELRVNEARRSTSSATRSVRRSGLHA